MPDSWWKNTMPKIRSVLWNNGSVVGLTLALHVARAVDLGREIAKSL
jgi:hypothetical protein